MSFYAASEKFLKIVCDLNSKGMNHSALYGFSFCFLSLTFFSVCQSKNELLSLEIVSELSLEASICLFLSRSIIMPFVCSFITIQ